MNIKVENDEPVELIDSHCHLDFPVFDQTRQSIIDDCRQNSINKFVVPGVTAESWVRLTNVSKLFSSIYPAYGLHPYFLNEHKIEHVDQLKPYIAKNPATAIGEIGLDYYRDDLDKKFQLELFVAQLSISGELNLPVILHVRKAHDDVLYQLRKHKVIGGIVHAFNGSFQQANQYLDLGFKLGFGGALTFDRAKHLRRLVAQLPLDAIVLETDSPDMKPANYFEKENTPLTLCKVMQEVLKLRQESSDSIANQILKNTYSIFPSLK